MGKPKTSSQKRNKPAKTPEENAASWELQTSLDRLQDYVETMPVMFYVFETSPTRRTYYFSPGFETLGYSLEEWQKDPKFWHTVVHPEDRDELIEKTVNSLKNVTEKSFVYRMITKSGEVRWFHDKARNIKSADGKSSRWQGVVVDITEQKERETEFEYMAEAYQTIARHVPDSGIVVFDRNLKYMFAAGSELEKYGLSQEVMEGKTVYDFFRQKRADAWAKAYRTALSGEHLSFEQPHTDQIYQVYLLPIKDKKGSIYAGMSIFQNITDRKNQESELQEALEKYLELFENANDLIYVHDLQGNFTSMNKAAGRVFGYTPEEALKLRIEQVVVPEHLEIVRQKIKDKIFKGSDKTSYEVECLTKDGRRVLIEVNSRAIYKDNQIIGIQGIARDITERKQTEIALKQREEQYRDLFENANDIIYTVDMKGNFTSLNRAGEILTGYKREDVVNKGFNFRNIVSPKYRNIVEQSVNAKLTGISSTQYELEIIAKDGTILLFEVSSKAILKNGKLVGIQGVARDITERRRAQEALIASEREYRMMSEGIMHHVWTATADGVMDYMNRRGLDYYGLTEEEVLAGTWAERMHPDDVENVYRAWQESIKTGKNFTVEFRAKRRDGFYRWFNTLATAGHDADGKIIKWFGTDTDIHGKKAAEERLNHFAKTDNLTDLPNRVEFMNRLETAIANRAENKSENFAVLFLDVDRFKVINDSLGHLVGDKLLCFVAERLRACVRPSDVVARLGGDEFTILLNKTGCEKEVAEVARRIQRKLSLAYKIDNHEVFTSVSIGVVLSDETPRKPEDFLRDADTAMYSAKEKGKARFEMFDAEMHTNTLNLLRVENDLRRAVERGEFDVYYQPVIDLKTGKITEFEALLRWQHPEKGLLSPLEFIDVAEETGMIIPIGEYVLKETCRQIRRWQDRFAEQKISVSVNLSAKQLMHPDLIPLIESVLKKTKIDAKLLKIEVTESVVMQQSDLALKILHKLSALGIALSTDDFGTGYSSLSYLHHFPFSRLKIDRSFIGNMETSGKSLQIVKSILSLASNLGVDVVAEGIETAAQLAELQNFGCDFGQGFYFSVPVAKENAEELLARANEFFIEPELLAFGGDIQQNSTIQ